jgi:pimeloyl-ACP methyl ester carboxylesterase
MRIEVGGLSIAYEQAGVGPTVALAHGFVGDGQTTWRHQIDKLCDQFTVVAWDGPGAGGSSAPPEHFGMDGYADCFAAFLRALGIETAQLVGISFGGALVLATFHRHRQLASSLAILNGYAGWHGSLGAAEARSRLARSLEVSELPAAEFADTMVPSMFSPSAGHEVVTTFAESVRAFNPAGFRAMATALVEDQSHVLPEVDVPTLLLCSDHDVRAPVHIAEAMHARIRHSRLMVLQGPGHVTSVEAPDEVTSALRHFLSSAG